MCDVTLTLLGERVLETHRTRGWINPGLVFDVLTKTAISRNLSVRLMGQTSQLSLSLFYL